MLASHAVVFRRLLLPPYESPKNDCVGGYYPVGLLRLPFQFLLCDAALEIGPQMSFAGSGVLL